MTGADLLPAEIIALARAVVAGNAAAGRMLALAESCTGGLVAAALTEIAGSSAVFDRGFVTYSDAAKSAMLGVPAEVIAKAGAVSTETARAMAAGALLYSQADVAVAVTGIAGPRGGSADKPVGTVVFARAVRGGGAVHVVSHAFDPSSRAEVRRQATLVALSLLLP